MRLSWLVCRVCARSLLLAVLLPSTPTAAAGHGPQPSTPTGPRAVTEAPTALLISPSSRVDSPAMISLTGAPLDSSHLVGTDDVSVSLAHGIQCITPIPDAAHNDALPPLVITPATEPQTGQEWLDEPLRFLVSKYGRPHVLTLGDFANAGDAGGFAGLHIRHGSAVVGGAGAGAGARLCCCACGACGDVWDALCCLHASVGVSVLVVDFGVGVPLRLCIVGNGARMVLCGCAVAGAAVPSLPGTVPVTTAAVAPVLRSSNSGVARTTSGGDASSAILVEPAPFQVPDLTAMSLLHYLFAICMYSRMYITQQGKLVGVVYKGDFLDEKWLPTGTDEVSGS